MYRVSEYYLVGIRLNPVRHLQDFDSLDEAKSFAQSAYRRLIQVPESERVRVCVVDEAGRVPYRLPDEGTDSTAA